MRDILYRGKRLDNGEWEYGFFVGRYDPLIEKDTIKYGGIDNGTVFFGPVKVDIKTLGEYTGLTDKNGTKIFEGDILKNEKGICFCGEYTAVVEFNNGEFLAGSNTINFYAVDFCVLEVIGNTHDNPELLKGE